MRTLNENEKEYKALELACEKMNKEAERLGYAPKYYVGDCYFDFGLKWVWTTIIYDEEGDGFQALCPSEWKQIVKNDNFLIVEEIVRSQESILHETA